MRQCQVCNKGPRMVGHRKLLRGHYNPTNWTRKYPNLQKAITPKGEKVKACVQCVKTFTKEARMAMKHEERAKAKALKLAKQKIKEEAERAKQEKKAARAKAAKEEKKAKPKKEVKSDK